MDDDRRCTATSKRSQQRCKRYAIRGGSVCSMHGGKIPQVQAAAQRRQDVAAVKADLKAVLAHEAIEPITDPVLALAELAAEVRAAVRALSARVNALDDLSYMSMMGQEQIRAEMTLLGESQDRLARMLTSLGKFNLDERRVQLSEMQAAILSQVINRVLSSLNLPPRELEAAHELTAATIREVAAEQGR